eukprot:jgi/Ulvmu1/12447/UM009_0099.1
MHVNTATKFNYACQFWTTRVYSKNLGRHHLSLSPVNKCSALCSMQMQLALVCPCLQHHAYACSLLPACPGDLLTLQHVVYKIWRAWKVSQPKLYTIRSLSRCLHMTPAGPGPSQTADLLINIKQGQHPSTSSKGNIATVYRQQQRQLPNWCRTNSTCCTTSRNIIVIVQYCAPVVQHKCTQVQQWSVASALLSPRSITV